MSKHSQISEFNVEGQFLGFAAEEGYKLKLIRISTATGKYRIKIPKELRSLLYRTLIPGTPVQVLGYQKFDPFKGTLKLKAEQVIPLSLPHALPAPLAPLPTALPVAPLPIGQARTVPVATDARPARSKPATILVCQKSDCCKRGGNQVVRALQAELSHRGLDQQVAIRGTGCMKQCKAGPNLVMPDKSRHSRIRPDEVPALIEQHFPSSKEIAS